MDNDITTILIKEDGNSKEIKWEDINNLNNEDGILWINLNYNIKENHNWLKEDSNIDSFVIDALLAEDTRPRTFIHDNGYLIILRGINLNPGADPDDMVSLRLWIEPNRIISIWRRKVMAIEDLKFSILNGKGPKTEGEFISQITRKLTLRMSQSINNISEQVDELEESIFEKPETPVRSTISDLRRQIIRLRRYLFPQLDVFNRLQKETTTLLDFTDLAELRETTDILIRYIEDLDASRERAAVVQDELESQLSSKMNRTMYLLSIVTVIFLPLGLITGLLGINVAGIPGANNPYAFIFVCLILVFVSIMQIILFKRKSWV
ncbi:MAG: zinc transporter ZntB [Spirochaetia bacterium]|nr:zinc transporter ZntB [Spirochaetia bacterium]